ncbi:unnamed protein product [Effrenium voratum]|nr:unnamed protein product [Effrenium voratum]
MLRCRAGHVVEKVKKLKPWQGHIHIRECVFCRNEIDRHEVHYSCPEKCRYDICQYCYKSQVAKRKAHLPSVKGNHLRVAEPGDSFSSVEGESASSVSSALSSPAKVTRPGDRRPSTASTPGPSMESARGGSSTRKSSRPGQVSRFRKASQEFLESSWQRSVEVVFWSTLVFAGEFVGALYLQHLTTAEDLAFPFPFLTACLSNLVAGLLVIAVLALLNRTNTREQCGEIAADAEVDLKMQLMLGVLVTCEIGAAVKVLSNVHHTMAAWVYMLTPVATILVASSNFFGMEVLRQELLVAAGVASLGGMLAVQGPLPSIEGLNALGWGCLALVFTVARCLLTQGVMCPTIGQRPGALSVAKAVLLAGCTVGVELSLVYEWHGFWSLPWLPFPGRVFQQVTVIGICDAIMVIGHTRLIQITSAAFGALLVPFYTVTVLPVESLDSLTTISLVNWLGLLLCGASAVMYFKARKNGTEPTEGYASLA